MKQIREDEIVFSSDMNENTRDRLITFLKSQELYRDLVVINNITNLDNEDDDDDLF